MLRITERGTCQRRSCKCSLTRFTRLMAFKLMLWHTERFRASDTAASAGRISASPGTS